MPWELLFKKWRHGWREKCACYEPFPFIVIVDNKVYPWCISIRISTTTWIRGLDWKPEDCIHPLTHATLVPVGANKLLFDQAKPSTYVSSALPKIGTSNAIDCVDHSFQKKIKGHEVERHGWQDRVHKDESTSSRKGIAFSSSKSLLNLSMSGCQSSLLRDVGLIGSPRYMNGKEPRLQVRMVTALVPTSSLLLNCKQMICGSWFWDWSSSQIRRERARDKLEI